MNFSNQIRATGLPSTISGFLRSGTLVAGVEVSVLVSEAHALSSSVSKLAVESGAQLSDHVIVNPVDVSIVFGMTNTGLGADAARDVFETFKRMQENRELVELITEHHVYDNMVITNLNPMHQAPYKGALNFTVKLQQISFVTLKSVGRDPQTLASSSSGYSSAPAVPPTDKIASAPVNVGQQSPQPVQDKSLAAGLFD